MNLEANLSRLHPFAATERAELAHLPPFQLGPLLVEPGLRRLVGLRGQARTIQPLAMRVLLFLIEARDETSSRDDLVEACWNQRIVGDDAVHRIISTLRRDLTQLSGGAAGIETIAKVGYRLRIDTERQAASAESVEAAPEGGKAARFWPVAAVAIVGLASIAWFAPTRATADVTQIAVVGDAGTGRGEATRFADGLTGDLARLAGAMPSLAFVEADRTSREEPLLLRVALEAGGEGPSARVRLVDREGGMVLWSREFMAEDGTIAELREVVANRVAGMVQCGLDRSAAFDDPVGLRLYLGACDGLDTRDYARARAFSLLIAEARPNAAAGWACLANTTIFAAAENGAVNEAVLDRAEAYARKALAVDPKSGLSYVALGMVNRWRGEPVLETLERGIRADPDFAMLHKHYAWALLAAGLVSQASDPALRALALHPHDPGLYQLAVAALLAAGRTEEAVALAGKMQRMWQYDRGVEMQRLSMLFYAPDPKIALGTFLTSPRHREPGMGALYETLVWRTDPKGYDWSVFDRTAQQTAASNADLAWGLSEAAARMGDEVRALAWLDRASADAFNEWWPLFAPEAAELRRDPRFFDKMASVGLVARWQKSDRWPDFCTDPGLRYSCRERANELVRRADDGKENGGRTRART